MTDIMPLSDAIRWIGPHEARDILGAPDPHAYAEEWCDHHAARADHHWPAWASLEWHLSPDNEEVDVVALTRSLSDAPKSWRDVIEGDPIPPWALLAARDEHDMTQEDLALALRCDARTIRRWEYGERLLSGPAAVAAALIFKNLSQDT